MVLDPIPQPLPVHFFGSRPQTPTSPYTYPPIKSVVQYAVHYLYGVASISKIDETIGLFCRTQSLLQGSFAKETCSLIDSTKRSHPIIIHRSIYLSIYLSIYVAIYLLICIHMYTYTYTPIISIYLSMNVCLYSCIPLPCTRTFRSINERWGAGVETHFQEI